MKKPILILGLILIGLSLFGCIEEQLYLPSEIIDCQSQGDSVASEDSRALEDSTIRETIYINYIDKCILNKAMISNNMELCTHLQKEENKRLCNCEKLDNLEKDTCYKQVAIDYNVGLHCYSIKDETIMKTCLTNFE
jgi:hypothetical protein